MQADPDAFLQAILVARCVPECARRGGLPDAAVVDTASGRIMSSDVVAPGETVVEHRLARLAVLAARERFSESDLQPTAEPREAFIARIAHAIVWYNDAAIASRCLRHAQRTVAPAEWPAVGAAIVEDVQRRFAARAFIGDRAKILAAWTCCVCHGFTHTEGCRTHTQCLVERVEPRAVFMSADVPDAVFRTAGFMMWAGGDDELDCDGPDCGAKRRADAADTHTLAHWSRRLEVGEDTIHAVWVHAGAGVVVVAIRTFDAFVMRCKACRDFVAFVPSSEEAMDRAIEVARELARIQPPVRLHAVSPNPDIVTALWFMQSTLFRATAAVTAKSTLRISTLKTLLQNAIQQRPCE